MAKLLYNKNNINAVFYYVNSKFFRGKKMHLPLSKSNSGSIIDLKLFSRRVVLVFRNKVGKAYPK